MRSVPEGGSVGSYSPRTYSEGNEVAAVQRKSQLPIADPTLPIYMKGRPSGANLRLFDDFKL